MAWVRGEGGQAGGGEGRARGVGKAGLLHVTLLGGVVVEGAFAFGIDGWARLRGCGVDVPEGDVQPRDFANGVCLKLEVRVLGEGAFAFVFVRAVGLWEPGRSVVEDVEVGGAGAAAVGRGWVEEHCSLLSFEVLKLKEVG